LEELAEGRGFVKEFVKEWGGKRGGSFTKRLVF
jgi:hypothetical protein